MILFWILWGIDAIVGIIAIYFFLVGLSDGSVSSFNLGLWLVILILLSALLGGTILLKSSDRLTAAKSLLAVLAVPAFLFGLYMLIALTSGSRWN